MDINNNQQINTFTKGMDTDTSDMYIGEGSYRYAENLRVVTDKDGNTGELHMIDGTYKLPNHTKLNTSFIGNEELLGFTSIRDIIIEIIKEGDSWSIVKSGESGKRIPVAGPFYELIWPDNWDEKKNPKPLSLVTRWESEDNIKLYIANGQTELLCANIAHDNLGSDYDKVFHAIKTTLDPIQAEVTTMKGAAIPGVVLQYAYVVYNVQGESTTMSMLSNVVSQQVDDTHGNKVDELGANIVRLTLPNKLLDNNVRIYRVAYSAAGQLPRVDVIFDQNCQSTTVQDFGQSLLNLSTAEFIATTKLLFVPKEIESKGDYLFAANIKYTQDEIDEKFKKFDARSYSYGNYYIQNNQKIRLFTLGDEELKVVPKNIDIHHDQFDSPNYEWDEQSWVTIGSDSGSVNGHGLCFDWKYSYNLDTLYYTKQRKRTGDDSQPILMMEKSYGRNEVYRFGVRLFDDKGNASSVKWIADIKMPGYYNGDPYVEFYSNSLKDEAVQVHPVFITFIPRRTDSEEWAGVAKYEIVQAKRSINDSYKIAQGIYGFPMGVNEDDLCLPYFLTTAPFRHKRALADSNKTTSEYQSPEYKLMEMDESLHGFERISEFTPYRKALIFSSPEYTYQPDDIQNLVDMYKSNIYCKPIASWTRDAQKSTFTPDVFNDQESTLDNLVNQQATILRYPDSTSPLCKPGTDLKIQIGTTGEHDGEYFISNQTIAQCNVESCDDVSTEVCDWVPLGDSRGNHDGGKKMVYFTNIFPQRNAEVGKYGTTKIQNVTYVKALSSDTFAANEKPTYKNEFSTLHNGKKFFNWTNPAIFDKPAYKTFTGGGEDTKESWNQITQTAYDDRNIAMTYMWDTYEIGGSYRDYRALRGGSCFAFPTATGGPSILLEFNDEFELQKQRTTNYMPQICVANIYKPTSPYGGYSVAAINLTLYISCGKSVERNTDGSFDDAPVSFGDNYISMFVYNLYHTFDNAQHNAVPTAGMQYIIPIESTIDLTKQSSNYLQALHTDSLPVGIVGDIKGNGVWVQAEPSTVAGRFTLTTDMYMYNTAYSVLPDIVTYSGEDTVNIINPLNDSRVHYSQKKNNNELIDSWTNFKAIDYLDVDSRCGLITGLKLFRDKLIFLQENGAGILSVNDRTILKDQNSANIIVGNGGVLDRFDYFTTVYGMKRDQHSIDATNSAIYWWDSVRKEILSYVDGYNVTLLQKVRNVQNYVSNGTESTIPSIISDTSKNEVLFNVVNDESLVYNEQTQSFTAVYKFNPVYYCNINEKMFLTDSWDDSPNLYEYHHDVGGVTLFGEVQKPMLRYVVNKDSIYNKVFDIQTFGGRFYDGDVSSLEFTYKTPLKQQSGTTGENVTDREYDFRLAVPRNHNDLYGGRMRGKTMECELTSKSNDQDFSIQYIITKYRMSWT